MDEMKREAVGGQTPPAKKPRRKGMGCLVGIVAVIVFIVVLSNVLAEYSYNSAVELWNEGEYVEASTRFLRHENRHDAAVYIAEFEEMMTKTLEGVVWCSEDVTYRHDAIYEDHGGWRYRFYADGTCLREYIVKYDGDKHYYVERTQELNWMLVEDGVTMIRVYYSDPDDGLDYRFRYGEDENGEFCVVALQGPLKFFDDYEVYFMPWPEDALVIH